MKSELQEKILAVLDDDPNLYELRDATSRIFDDYSAIAKMRETDPRQVNHVFKARVRIASGRVDSLVTLAAILTEQQYMNDRFCSPDLMKEALRLILNTVTMTKNNALGESNVTDYKALVENYADLYVAVRHGISGVETADEDVALHRAYTDELLRLFD